MTVTASSRFSAAYDRALETHLYYDAFMIDRRLRRLRAIRSKAPANSSRRTVIDCWIWGLKDARDKRQKEDGYWKTVDTHFMEHWSDMPLWALPIFPKVMLHDDDVFWASWSVTIHQTQRECSALALKEWAQRPHDHSFREYWYTWRHDGVRMQFLGIFPTLCDARQATAEGRATEAALP